MTDVSLDRNSEHRMIFYLLNPDVLQKDGERRETADLS